ncbi:hypothetical protein PC9H_009323 [Pleurotus ostreatus]|uniref:Uncharacterized protein n=1 Tax=Pleurotus ostreatus TaxID=5322 RepID=A0A8H6ZLL1_PLEOS|nr:uncharacterized protein PC9H_009323 [Pleurotus ostreatus]KAF7424023.1 hypothetical protein PC9H_009323 [Pleurotus ostreatus]
MSSNEDEGDGSSYLQNAKKRRIQRACDICRRKKSDGSQMPGNRCSNCIAYSFECSYVEAARKRGPPKGYVESLENRLEKMEKLLKRLYPDGDFSKDLDQFFETSGEAGTPICAPMSPDPNLSKSPTEFASNVIRSMGEVQSRTIIPDDDDDLGHVVLEEDLGGLEITDQIRNRFFGKSSGAMLLQAAMDLKDEYTGQPKRAFPHPNILSRRRDEFWSRPDWEPFVSEPKNPDYIFPDPDLIPPLVDAYFKYYNIFFPLLHRPTFERGIAEGLHLTNDTFAGVVLLVCANGARYSNDPRVLLEGNSPHSSGWKWFTQIQMVRKSLLAPPTLYDLQFYCLTVQFLQGSSAPHACWIMVGIGIRLAQDVGAHRRKAHTHKLSVEDELWKRAFWVLVAMDRVISTILGRPVAIQDEDFDLDLPMEVDDEYWEHPDPDQAFKQPPNKPSLVTFFNCYLRLNQVLGIALRTIYSINKSKILLGFVGAQWEQHIVAELDSALNKWVDSVPDHLRWDPNREDLDFFSQSAMLYTHYYHLQILIHRPFIRKPSPLAFPSMAICTNAARTCSHIVDINSRRCLEPQPHLMSAAFTAGVVLLLNIWAGKRSGLTTDPKKEMADVHKCMKMLRSSEKRQDPDCWSSMVGRYYLYTYLPTDLPSRDILYELASVGDLPLPQASPAPNKRERGSDSPASSTTEDASVTMSPPNMPRSLAGSRRIASKDPISLSSRGTSTMGLPIHSEELGRLPLHGEADPNSLIRTDNDMQAGTSTANANANANGFWYPSFAPQPPNMPGPSSNLGPVPSGELSLADQTIYEQLMMTTMRMPYNQQYQQPLSDPTLVNNRPLDPLMMQTSPSMPQQMTLDPDTIAMWTNAPSGFELDDWGQYLSNVSELTQGMPPSGDPNIR